jgi:valyl-tRNA synthetase
MDLFVKKNQESDASFDAVIIKMGNLSQLEYVSDKINNAYSFLVNSNEYFIPFGDNIDLEAEREKLEEELIYTQGFLNSVMKKLQNEKFVAGAPEQVLDNERKKEADARQKIAILEEKLAGLE